MNQIESIIQELYANNQSKLHQLCNKEMSKFGGISQMEYDNFYSRVGLELSLVKKKYEKMEFVATDGKTAMDYICGVIKRSVWKEMSDKNRLKRQLIIEKKVIDENGNIEMVREYIPNLSIDAPIGDENYTIGDMIADDFSVEDEIFGNEEEQYSEEILLYLNKLSNLQKEVLKLNIAGFLPNEIKEELHITDKQYEDCQVAIHSYRNISVLF